MCSKFKVHPGVAQSSTGNSERVEASHEDDAQMEIMSGVLICVTRSHEITLYFVLVSLKRLETRKQEDSLLVKMI